MNRFRHSVFRPILRWLAFLGSIAITTAYGQTNLHLGTEGRLSTNTYWAAVKFDPATYDSPYRISLFNPLNGEDGERVWSQTKSIFAYGFGVIGVLLLIPEEHTGWDPDPDILNKWGENVSKGPIWDRNNWIYNYVGHIYFGGVYYQVARKSGYRQWDAFFYSFLMSTFYWEYGVEAFAEVPSIQDLVVTPLMGWVYGEWAFQAERKIRSNGNELLGSKGLGTASLWFLDPVDNLGRVVNRVSGRKLIKAGYGYFSYTAAPVGDRTDHQFYLHMRFPIGVSGPSQPPKDSIFKNRNDPVDTGIVGISIGTGQTQLDEEWEVDDGEYRKISMGLYFSPHLSARFGYARAHLTEQDTDRDVIYENYSLDGQLYFNTEHTFRPYVTAGFGELIWDQDLDKKTFQWNGGIGLHYQFHRKWALQADWIHYYSPSDKTYDQQMNAGIVYRFGRGEHNEW